MGVAICPGSFDPVTVGHLDIIRRASRMFDEIIVLVMSNVNKSPMFTLAERVDFLKRVTGDIENVRVDSYDGLLAEYAKSHNASTIVKGLRAMSDFEYEFQMALTNRRLNPDIETTFLTTAAENMYLSSSLVKQVSVLGGDITGFVPDCIKDEIVAKANLDADK